MPKLRDVLDVEKQFVFYASYHHQWTNVLIHLVCIWPIFATALCMLQVRMGLGQGLSLKFSDVLTPGQVLQ